MNTLDDLKTPKGRHSFYLSLEWKNLRNYKLSMTPLCEECKRNGVFTGANEVDHIIPIVIDPEKRLDIDNLQSLCKSCHSAKTYLENKDKMIQGKKNKELKPLKKWQ